MNETSISMTKILEYENREIASWYLLSTSMILVVADVVSVALGALVMTQAWKAIMFSVKLLLNVLDLNHPELTTDEDRHYEIDQWARMFKAKTWNYA